MTTDPHVFDVVAIGGAAIDRKYRLAAPAVLGTSNPAIGSATAGGVARNVAVTLAELGVRVAFASAIGADEAGARLRAGLEAAGVGTSVLLTPEGARTAEYVAILDGAGDLVMGIADMSVLDAHLDVVIDAAWPLATRASWLFADCNMPRATFERFLARRRGERVRLAVDAVSVAKAARLPDDLTGVDVLFLTLAEARAALDRPGLDAPTAAAALGSRGAAAVIVTLGAEGFVLAERAQPPRAVPALLTSVVDVTGAGDSFIAATLWRLVRGDTLATAAMAGRKAAALTIATAESTRARLRDLIEGETADD